MKSILATCTFFFASFGFAQNSSTTYYLIRHAEKFDQSKNPDLSKIGLERAQNWNKILSEVHFDAIYSTDYKRTLQTATPTAERCQKEITLYNPQNTDIQQFKKDTSGKTVLIVGHSNTIPNLVNQLIDKKQYGDIEETTFGNLYIVTIHGNSASSQLLKLP